MMQLRDFIHFLVLLPILTNELLKMCLFLTWTYLALLCSGCHFIIVLFFSSYRELFMASRCVASKVRGCSQPIQNTAKTNFSKKLEFFIRHCPISKMMHEMCNPAPTPMPICDIQYVHSACLGRFDRETDICKWVITTYFGLYVVNLLCYLKASF